MHSGLRRRVRELEKRSGADGSFILLPLPDQPGRVVRLPRAFAEFLAHEERECRAAGGYFNLTDGQWTEC